MKVLKIICTDGSDFHFSLERGEHAIPIEPHFPDAASVELLDMTPEEYQATEVTVESAERFGA